MAQAQLNKIFNSYQNADTVVELNWNSFDWYWKGGVWPLGRSPGGIGHPTNEIKWYKNCQFIGSALTCGGCEGETHGRLRQWHGKGWGHHDSSALEKWNSICVPERNKDLVATIEAIKQRAILLFDFEMNPNSELQKLYQRSEQVAPRIYFPTVSLQKLIDQFNDFIRCL